MAKQLRNDGLKFGEGTILQRGESWQARWQETRGNGKVVRRGRSFPSQDAAEDHLRQMFRTRRDGRYVPPSELTVQEVIAGWLMRGAARWKPWTHVTYRARAELHIYPELGALRAETLTTPRVQHWIDGKIRAGLAPATIDAAVTVLRSALKEATLIGILTRNPVSGARSPKVEIKETATWTPEDVQRVLRAIDDPMWAALYRVALATGMRPGEVRTIRWADIDLEAMTITIRRTISRDAEGHVAIGKSTKTGRSRVNALSSPEISALLRWRTVQKERQLAASTWIKTDLVFDRGNGQYLPQATWHRYHVELCKRAGVHYVKPHALRHTNATEELSAGTNPKIVAERLGHRSIQTTLDRYSHVTMTTHREAASRLSSRLFGDEAASNDG